VLIGRQSLRLPQDTLRLWQDTFPGVLRCPAVFNVTPIGDDYHSVQLLCTSYILNVGAFQESHLIKTRMPVYVKSWVMKLSSVIP